MKKTLMIISLLIAIPSLVFAQEARLIVQDDSGATTFEVQDNGTTMVESNDGTGKIQVFENEIPVNPSSPQTMFELNRGGAVRFDLVDESTGATWVFQNRNSAFDITLAGTGVQEFKVDENGDLTISGTLTELSDVNSKENITAVEGERMLARLAELPVAKWNYKSDAAKSPHVGPMAQDFHAAFGLGSDERHIAPRDLAGVAVVGVKELHKQNLEQTKMIEQRDAEIGELKERLAVLEQIVKRLTLEGDKLASATTP